MKGSRDSEVKQKVREKEDSCMQKERVRVRAEKGGGRRMRTQAGGCNCVNSGRQYVFFHFLNIIIIVMPNSVVLGKETWESLDSERVETRVS